MRPATSAAIGALVAVGGWIAWSALAPADPPPEIASADAVVAANAAPPTKPAPSTPLPERGRMAPASAVAPVQARPPTLRDGLVMEHGLATAVHAPADDGTRTMTPPAVLPPGVRGEDAVINPAGMVTLTRSVAAPATSQAEPPRPAVAERGP